MPEAQGLDRQNPFIVNQNDQYENPFGNDEARIDVGVIILVNNFTIHSSSIVFIMLKQLNLTNFY